jgi:hypothetical protein
MRTKVTLGLIFLNVAVFFFIFYLKNSIPSLDEKRGILGPEVVNIQALEINQANRPEPIRLERRGETWNLVRPIEWPANAFAVRRILNELQQLRSQASFAVRDLAKNGQSLADYGLEKPPVVLTFIPALQSDAGSGEPVTLRIGETSPVGNRLYVLQPDGERVHVVNRSLAESVAVGVDELRSDAIFTIRIFELRSLNLQTGSPANLKVRIARTDSRWHFESPITARAEKTKTELAISHLHGLRIHSFVDSRESDTRQFSPEEMTLRVTMEGTNGRETLVIGRKLATPPPPRPSTGTSENNDQATPESLDYYFGKMDEKAPVFIVGMNPALLRDLTAAQQELRDRQILDLDPAAISSITLSGASEPEITIQRLEANAAAGSQPGWEIVRRINDRAPQPVPADREIVGQLLQNLIELRAQRFETDAPTGAALEDFGFNRPARRIQVTSTTPRQGQTAENNTASTLLIGIGVDRQTYAKLESPNYVYRVSNEILQQTPINAMAYRDRTLRQLPTGASITTLQLTDLASQNAIVNATLPLPAPDAAGATLSPQQRSAVEALATQLRTIRAKSFVNETFTKTVTVAGEDRPWKYQLTCTLALVGGNGAQTESFTLFFSERAGGSTQLVGSPELDVVFEAEQPLIDALFALTYGPRDPGPANPERKQD